MFCGKVSTVDYTRHGRAKSCKLTVYVAVFVAAQVVSVFSVLLELIEVVGGDGQSHR